MQPRELWPIPPQLEHLRCNCILVVSPTSGSNLMQQSGFLLQNLIANRSCEFPPVSEAPGLHVVPSHKDMAAKEVSRECLRPFRLPAYNAAAQISISMHVFPYHRMYLYLQIITCDWDHAKAMPVQPGQRHRRKAGHYSGNFKQAGI